LRRAFHDDRRQISEPLIIAYLFTEKRTGDPADSIAFVPSKDAETAKLVLAALGFDEVPSFLDYALAEAKKTNFDIQTLSGTKEYLASFLALRQREAADQAQKAARKARQQEDARRKAYDRYRRSAATDIFAALPKSEQGIMKGLVQTHRAKFGGSLQDSMAEFGRIRVCPVTSLKTLGIPHRSTRQRRPIPPSGYSSANAGLSLRVDDERFDRPQSTPISMGAISRAYQLPNKKP
jgi:hypothetical protein